ncbi:MAG: M55 family metallopeptidase [Thermomicrobiales bacterium]
MLKGFLLNVYISVDIEGISGVVHADMMGPGQAEYARGRTLMVGDANAAIEGAIQAGAEQIYVVDGHGPMRNLLIEEINPAVTLVTGTADARDFCQLQEADSLDFTAAIFVGYHAMAKTLKAIHPHTIAGAVVHELRISGRPHGETGLNAFVLASLGIPTVMVSGDETTCAEARLFLGESIQTVAVKSASGRNSAACRHPSLTQPEITGAAKLALTNVAAVPLYTLDGSPVIEIDFLTMAQCDRARRVAGVERTGGVTVKISNGSPWEMYRTVWSAIRAALYEPASFLA